MHTIATTTQEVKLSQDFHNLLDQRQALSETLKMLEAEKKEVDEQIKATLGELGVSSVKTVKWSVKLTESERKTLDENLLLMNGVQANVIQESKKVTRVVSLSVREIKEEKN